MGNWQSKSKETGASAASEHKAKNKHGSPKQGKRDGNKEAASDQYVDMLKAKRQAAPPRRRPRVMAATVADPAGEIYVTSSNIKNSPIKTKVLPGAIALASASPSSAKHRTTEKSQESRVASPVTVEAAPVQPEAPRTISCDACPPADQVAPDVAIATHQVEETPQGAKDDSDKNSINANNQASEPIQAAPAFRKEVSPARVRETKSVADFICGNSGNAEETKAKRTTLHSHNNTDDHSKAPSPALLDFQKQLKNAETVEQESTKL